MYSLIVFLKKLLKILTTHADPWQIATGSFIGCIFAWFPFWPDLAPSPLIACLLFITAVANIHLGSVLLFWGTWSIPALLSQGIATSLGNSCASVASWSAHSSFLAASGLNHTGHLGQMLLGTACAFFTGALLFWFTKAFRSTWEPKLKEKKKLIKAGKTVSHPIWSRVVCWFFGI